MEVYLEDIQEAEAVTIRTKNQYLRERGWKEEHNQFKKDLLWGIDDVCHGNGQIAIPATQLTTEEAIDSEKIFNKTNLHRG